MQLIPPHPPRRPLEGLSDRERKIWGGPVWDLHQAQLDLREGRLRPLTTKNVSDALNTDLGWNLRDVKNGFQMLRPPHYNQSEWVWLQGNTGEPLPADSDLLPCERTPDRDDTPPLDVRVYLKFTLPNPLLHIFFVSVHPSI